MFNTFTEHKKDASMNSLQRLPTVVIFTNGGVIENSHVNCAARVVILDGDTEGGDRENIVEFNGAEFYMTDQSSNEPEQDFIDEVLSQLGQDRDAADMLIALTSAVRADGAAGAVEPIAQTLATCAEVLGMALTAPDGLRGAQSVPGIVAAMKTLVEAVGSVRLGDAASSAAGRADDYLEAREQGLKADGDDADGKDTEL